MSTTGEIPFLKVYNLTFDGTLDFSKNPTFISRKTHEETLRRSRSKPGDVLMNIVGPPLGKVSILPDTFPEWNFNQAIVAFRVDPERLDNRFLAAYLIHESRNWASRFSKATVGQHNIAVSDCREMLIPVPPLDEQRRIVAKLDTLQSRSRLAREALDAVPPLLEKLRQSILASAFRGDLTRDWRAAHPDLEPVEELLARIPKPQVPRRAKSKTIAIRPGDYGLSIGDPGTPTVGGWRWVSLLDIARMESGHTPSRLRPEWWGGQVPWIGIKDARDHHGRTIMETRQTTNAEGLKNSAARLLPEGTVCLSRTATIGYATVMGKDMATSQDFVNWVCNNEALDPHWLKLLFIAEKQALLSYSSQSTNVATIFFPELLAFHVCLPPLDEQQEIVRVVQGLMTSIAKLERSYEQASDQLPMLANSILASAFRGQLNLQTPNSVTAKIRPSGKIGKSSNPEISPE